MGGSAIDDDWELTAASNEVRTVVLVGRTGNGKSSTGNSILGRKAFVSKSRSYGITSTCELQNAVMRDGQVVNVIDTPGLFDFSAGSEFAGKEIVKCINLAKDGIHAVLVVFSVKTRFSKEEEAAVQTLQNFFGEKIADYMIVVFTGGDELEDNDETLDDYLGLECPEPLLAKPLLEQGRGVIHELLDPRLKLESCNSNQITQMVQAAAACLTNEDYKRPGMYEVISILQGEQHYCSNRNMSSFASNSYVTDYYPHLQQTQSEMKSHLALAMLGVSELEDDDHLYCR